MNAMKRLLERKENSLIRKKEIDIAKGIGIIAVVYGHTVSSLHTYIYIFHMPLFFIISGFLYASKEKEPLVPYVKKKMHSLLIAYLILLTLTNLLLKGLYAITGQVFTIYPSMLFRPYGASGALWFLLALTWVTIIYKLIDIYIPYNFKAATVMLLFVIGRLLSDFGIAIPTYLDTALTSLVFFLSGIILCKYIKLFDFELIGYMIGISILPCILIDLPMNIDLMYNKYEPFYFMFLSVAISFLIIRISHIESFAMSKVGSVLAYLGGISLIILALHIFTFEFWYFVIPKETLHDPQWPWADLTAIAMTITSILVIVLMNKIFKLDLLLDWLSGSHRLTESRKTRKRKQNKKKTQNL
jgi:fucose 4-O-acetylase-like acetyltransferase